jgi:hypothetical protein
VRRRSPRRSLGDGLVDVGEESTSYAPNLVSLCAIGDEPLDSAAEPSGAPIASRRERSSLSHVPSVDDLGRSLARLDPLLPKT